MTRLSAEQLEHLHLEGYVVVEDLLDPEEVLDPLEAEYDTILDSLATELYDDGFENALVHFIQAVAVNFQHGQSRIRNLVCNGAISLYLCKVTDTTKEVIGNPRSATAPPGNFRCSLFINGDLQQTGGARDDARHVVGGIIVEPFANGKACE